VCVLVLVCIFLCEVCVSVFCVYVCWVCVGGAHDEADRGRRCLLACPTAESVAARQSMPAWRLSQDGVERIRATMLKFNKDQDARRAEAAASEACRWKSLSVSTKAMSKQFSKGRMSGEVATLLPGYEAKQSADLDMLHVVGEEVAALFKSPAPLAAGAEQNCQGKKEIYPSISTRKAATNNRFHRESPSWEVI